VKRDPRLRPLSERRSERRLHGLRFTTAGRLLALFGIQTRRAQKLVTAYAELRDKADQARQAFIDSVLTPHARQLASEPQPDEGQPDEPWRHPCS
jgi:hypothetical protein